MTEGFRVAYLLLRYPALRETYVVREMYWLREMGVDVRIFSLLSPRRAPVHEQAESLMPYVRYSRLVSREVLTAQAHFLRRSPGRYFLALFRVIWQTLLEPGVLARALAVFPETVLYAREMRALQVDHIHAHFVWVAGISAGVISDLTGLSFSTCPHAFGLFARNRRDVRVQLENADTIVTISEYNREQIASLSQELAARPISVVHCGVEIDRYVPTTRQDDGQRPTILAVGGLVEKKGYQYLIEACAILAERGLDFSCEIVGSGPLRRELESLAERLGLGSRLWLLGALSHDDVVKLYARADLFALACVVASDGDRDGIPVALMEAMACGLPVVSTHVSGIPELVRDGKTGLCVPQRDADALANALARLIKDPQLRDRLGRGAREIIVEQFEARQSAAAVAQLLVQTIAAKPAQRLEPRDLSQETEVLSAPPQFQSNAEQRLGPETARGSRDAALRESQGD